MTILLVRNAGDKNEPEGLFAAMDTPLSTEGETQAKKLASMLSLERPVAIYSSSARRSRQTVEPLAGVLGLTIIEDTRLNDYSSGAGYGGRSKKDLAVAGTVADIKDSNRVDLDRVYFGQETLNKQTDRLWDFVADMARRYGPNDVVVASTHQTSILCLTMRVQGRSAKEFWNDAGSIGLASVSKLTFDGQKWTIELPQPLEA